MRLRELTNYWRYRRIVRNPWQAATARRIPEPGTLVPMELRPRGRVFSRGGTADVRVFRGRVPEGHLWGRGTGDARLLAERG